MVIAMAAPADDAFHIHHVVDAFHINIARYKKKLNFHFFISKSFMKSKGIQARKINPAKPDGGHAKKNRSPERIAATID
jgi:hypothetical protein